MKNTIKGGRVSFAFIRTENGRFLGICREFGFVEEGKSYKEVHDRMMSSSKLLLETVSAQPELEPSLNVAPPLRYLLIYYFVRFGAIIARMRYSFVSFLDTNRSSLAYA